MKNFENHNLSRSGLTLIELRVVHGIVPVLLAVLIPSISAIMRARSRAVTMKRLQQLGTAVILLIDDQARLGEQTDSSDFIADPLRFLMREPRAVGKAPYLDLVTRECGRYQAIERDRYQRFATDDVLRGSCSSIYGDVVGSGTGIVTVGSPAGRATDTFSLTGSSVRALLIPLEIHWSKSLLCNYLQQSRWCSPPGQAGPGSPAKKAPITP